jgi:general secretion pathway protein G
MTRRSMAFTLVEVLIVVIILGILAAVVLPKFSNASAIARASMLADDLRILRMQVQVYKSQHTDIPPGYPAGLSSTPDHATFIAQMTQSTDRAGTPKPLGTAGFPYGPYLQKIPPNPVNGKDTVRVLANGETPPAQASDNDGWIYQPQTLILKADCVGVDDTNKNYYSY